MMQKYVARGFFLVTGIILITGHLYSQDLRLLIGNREVFIESRQNQGTRYYRLNRIADVLDLNLEEEGNSLVIRGDRGELGLSDGRPLVRSGDEYLLLSAAVWKRNEKDWYVPVDFLQKALPGVLKVSLVRESRGRYRVRGLGENRVRLSSIAYPDRVAIVFTPSNETEIRVQDYKDFIEISFGNLLVTPSIQSQPSERKLIGSVTFNPQVGLGNFRIEKGISFSHFREQRLKGPDRLVLNIYPKPGYRIASAGPGRDRYPDRATQEPIPGNSDSPVADIEDIKQPGVVVIDPGHGGQDRGVDTQLTESPEKTLNLQISKALERELQRNDTPSRLTRYRDVNLSIEQRSAVANYYDAKVYLGIHIGASPSSQTHGPVVYIYAPIPEEPDEEGKESTETGVKQKKIVNEPLDQWKKGQISHITESRRLARRLQSSLNSLFQANNSINSAPLEVLAPIQGPAVIVELGQLSSSKDRNLLSDPGFISRLVRILSAEVIRFTPLSNTRVSRQ